MRHAHPTNAATVRRRILALSVLAAIPLLDGCGASAPRRAEAPGVAPDGSDQAALEAPIVRRTPHAEVFFRRYRVGPTVSTEAAATSTVPLEVDTASWSIVRAALEADRLPAPGLVRVEEVLHAFPAAAVPGPAHADAPRISAELLPSPNRPGYHTMVLTVRAPLAPRHAAGRRVAVVLDAVAPARVPDLRAGLDALVDELGPSDHVMFVVDGAVALGPVRDQEDARLRAFVEALPTPGAGHVRAGIGAARAAGADHIVLCTGAAPVDDPRGLLAAAAGTRTDVVGFLADGYDDALAEQLAWAGGGAYHVAVDGVSARAALGVRLAGAVRAAMPPTSLQVRFEREAVARWRLVGFEGARTGRLDALPTGSLGAGEARTLVYEVKLTEARGNALALVRARVAAGGWRAVGVVPRSAIRADFDRSSPGARLAVWITLAAERLRGSWWARSVAWPAIVAGVAGAAREMPDSEIAALHSAGLLDLVEAAAALHSREPAGAVATLESVDLVPARP
jgi:Ca-activated chloride channel family protein